MPAAPRKATTGIPGRRSRHQSRAFGTSPIWGSSESFDKTIARHVAQNRKTGHSVRWMFADDFSAIRNRRIL
jgi:hypothetical protein